MLTEDYGRRPFVSLVQDRARTGHHVPYAIRANSPDPAKGFRDLSYADLNAAADACAWLVDAALPNTPNFETFGWLGPVSDLRYFTILLAAMKTRKKVLFVSPRNSIAAQVHLLNETNCNLFFLDDKETFGPIIKSIREQRPLETKVVPSLDDLIDSRPKPYNFTRSYEECWLEPVCVLHTSGSTGLPKPVTIKHHYWTAVDALNRLPEMGLGRYPLTKLGQSRNFVPMPLFHCGGLLCGSAFNIYFNHTLVSTPDMSLTAESVNQVLKHAKPNWLMLPAATIKDLVGESSYHENIKTADYFTWGGAPLPMEVGAVLFKLTNSLNTFGMTEASALPVDTVPNEDWPYHRFSPVLGAEFRPVSDDQYEMVMVRDPEYELFQTVFSTFPELKEFHTKDLWSPHPTKPNLWSYQGRKDDLIIFSNGEKLNPSSIEGAVTAHPQVAGALVLGVGHFQAGLLVEPKQPVISPDESRAFLEALWPSIKQANEETPHFGRISKDLIIFTSAEKPFPRAAKGSIQRSMAMKLYKDEIDALYASGPQSNGHMNGEVDIGTTGSISSDQTRLTALRAVVSGVLGDANLGPRDDLFSQGMDSLLAANISRQVNRQLGRSALTPQIIYSCPTLQSLAEHLSGESKTKDRIDAMQTWLDELSHQLPVNARPAQRSSTVSVLLIGSTGSLGPHLLDALVRDPSIGMIYCLDRSKNSKEKQGDAHRVRGLSVDFRSVSFVQGSQGSPYLGVGIEQWKHLQREVTHVIHSAWPINFNMALESFAPAMRTVRQLIDFAALSLNGATLHFISSTSTGLNRLARSHHDADSRQVPEDPITDWSDSMATGYAESKLVSERLLAAAATTSSIPASILRVGQICGPAQRTGAWPKREWLPSLIASSAALGALPTTLGSVGHDINWIPVDLLAGIIADLAVKPVTPGALRVANLVNPNCSASWEATLRPAVVAYFEAKGLPLRSVGLREWVEILAESAAQTHSSEELERIPAVKLLPFFRGLASDERETPAVQTTETCACSAALAAVEPVSSAWMERWLAAWDF